VPFAEHAGYFNSGGVRIRYVMRGQGEPVIMLHGFIFSAKSNWIEGGVFEALSQDYRVVALDLRGHGESGKPHDAGSYGLKMINDVLRLMDHLKIERAHMIGYSLGGILALKLIEVAPERLLSLVLGGESTRRNAGERQTRRIALISLLAERARTAAEGSSPDCRQQRSGCFGSPIKRHAQRDGNRGRAPIQSRTDTWRVRGARSAASRRRVHEGRRQQLCDAGHPGS